ncbi:MAG TPA: hypothetical protein PLS63_13075 [Microthrixaceae bacterium]|nr:hypothetical protein [Microthrixaceae bacterium]
MDTQRSSWAVGYEAFAAIMLMVIGVFHVIAGIVALVEDQFFVVGQKWVFQFDVTTWGWIHLLLGIVVFVSGIGIFSGNVAARTVGVIVAAVSAIASFLWLPYYPVWSVLIIALDIAIIWALTIHGRDIASESV